MTSPGKHTAGPWRADETPRSNFSVRSSSGTVCRVSISPDSIHRERGLADTHLIAAAPDLLRELNYLVDWLEDNRLTIDGEFSMAELLADPRAAILKATGDAK